MTSWRYDPTSSPRDLRLDLLRGLCLLRMVWDHLWLTPLHALQSWVGYLSAAEGFFLLSGSVAGIVYGRRAEQHGLRAAAPTLARRGVHLYVSNLALVFLFFALEVSALLPYAFLAREGAAWTTLLDFNQPYFLQMLPRYAAYLLVAPAALWCLVRGRTPGLLVVSVGLYLLNLARGGTLRVPGLEDGELGGFHLVSWQLLFFVGMAAGYHREQLAAGWRALPPRTVLVLSGLGVVALSLFERAVSGGLIEIPSGLMVELAGRARLGPLRLLNLAVAAVLLFALVDRYWQPIRRWLGPILLPLGQSALYVFLVHILLVGLAWTVEHRLPFGLQGHPERLIVADLFLLSLHWAAARYRVLGNVIPR